MEDEPVIKPRRARGTPLVQYRNKIAWRLCGVFFGIHLISVYLLGDRIERKIAIGWYEQTRYTKDRRARMQLYPTNTTTDIRELEYEIEDSRLRDHIADAATDSDLR